VAEFISAEAGGHGKRIEPAAAARLIDLIGPEAGLLAGEIEKLALYAGERPTIAENDVIDLVGQSREEKIFAVADAAGAGRLARALTLWRQVLESDPDAPYRAVGGLAFVFRRWLLAHRLRDAGEPIGAVAPRVMMWGRERELEAILRRTTPRNIRGQLAALAELDAQAKSGLRSIETGIELLLAQLAA
jgi:DNA polymerase III delta subunit